MNSSIFSKVPFAVAADSGKKIYDSIHGFIELSSLEFELIQSPYFERLRYIHQLGAALFVYPGARISRFEHSLGVLHIASQIFDQLIHRSHAEKSLEAYGLESQQDQAYYRAVLRCAALVHDIGHLPFSHVGEIAFANGEEKLHERLGKEVLLSKHFDAFFTKVESEYGKNFRKDVVAAAFEDPETHKTSSKSPWLSFISKIIPSDYYGADRIDYLLRDTYATGLSERFDSDQLIDKLTLVQKPDQSLDIAILQSGLESVEGLLVCRYFVHRSLYYNEGVRTFSMHLANVMRENFKAPDTDSLLSFTDTAVLSISASTQSAHALAIQSPYTKRFEAVEIVPLTTSQELLDLELNELASKLKAPKECIDIEYATRLSKSAPLKSTLLVQKDRGAIVEASELSVLIREHKHVLNGKKYWIFTSENFNDRLLSLQPKTFEFCL